MDGEKVKIVKITAEITDEQIRRLIEARRGGGDERRAEREAG